MELTRGVQSSMSRADKSGRALSGSPVIIETTPVHGGDKFQLDISAALRILAASMLFRVGQNWKKLLRAAPRGMPPLRKSQVGGPSWAAWRVWLALTSKLLGMDVLSSRPGMMTKGIEAVRE